MWKWAWIVGALLLAAPASAQNFVLTLDAVGISPTSALNFSRLEELSADNLRVGPTLVTKPLKASLLFPVSREKHLRDAELRLVVRLVVWKR